MARDKSATGTAGRSGSRRIGRGAAAGPARGAASGPGKGTSKASPKDKARVKANRAQKRAARRERFGQLKQAFTMTRKADPRLVPWLLMALLVPVVLLLALGLLIGHPVLLTVLGVMVGVVAATAVFGRRVQRNAYSQVEGQAGAAAAVIDNMRGDWRVTPVVGFTREQDMVHRVIGKPGVILVGEGSPGRARGLMITEKKRLARFLGDVPVYDVMVGEGEGQVPLRGLEKHFVKLPQNIKPKDVNVLDRKLKAMAPAVPVPKGPVPGNGRVPRGKVR